MENRNENLLKECADLEASFKNNVKETRRLKKLTMKMNANRTTMNKAMVQLNHNNNAARCSFLKTQNKDLLAKRSAEQTVVSKQKAFKALAVLENTDQVKSLRAEEKVLQDAKEELNRATAKLKKLKNLVTEKEKQEHLKTHKFILEMVQISVKFSEAHKRVS